MQGRGKANFALGAAGKATLHLPFAAAECSLEFYLSFVEPEWLQAPRAKQRYFNQLWHELFFMVSRGRFREELPLVEALSSYLQSEGSAPGGLRGRLSFTRVECASQILLPPVPLKEEISAFGRVYIVYEDQAVGIYRLVIAPGREIPPHLHQHMDEIELVITDGLSVQGRAVKSGICHHWPRNYPHGYFNPSGEEQVVLCIDHPPFIPDDERLIEPRPPLQWLEGTRRTQLWRA
jgi:mannose-6-phosphate isomerase-like protein (cupin superfamily)